MTDKCIVCEKKLGFFEGDENRRCGKCISSKKWPEGHPNLDSLSAGSETMSAEPDGTKPSSTPKTGAAEFAFFCAGVIGLVSLLSCLLLVMNSEVLLAVVSLFGGLTSAAILAVLAEISHNTAIAAKLLKVDESKRN